MARPSCTGGKNQRLSTSNWASPRPTWSASSASSAPPGADTGSRCYRSECCMTRSSNAPSNPGHTASTPAAQSILVGTPSGVTLAAEGGAHQSIKTPSIGIEQPGCVSYEPAFASTRNGPCWPVSPGLASPTAAPHTAAVHPPGRPGDGRRAGRSRGQGTRRRQVVAGGYLLRRTERPAVAIAAMGAVVPEALIAATRLEQLGTPPTHLRDQPRPAVSGGARPPGTRTSRLIDRRPDLPRSPRRAASHRPRRPPARPGVPRYINRVPTTAWA